MSKLHADSEAFFQQKSTYRKIPLIGCRALYPIIWQAKADSLRTHFRALIKVFGAPSMYTTFPTPGTLPTLS
eukprot:gene13363-9568_t